MAHEVESMFSVRETPWHKLGAILDNPPTSAEAIHDAGLAWEVAREPLFLADGRTVERFANVRATDRAILGTVGPDYTLLQNAEAFSWFDPILESGEATLETAGSLRGGCVVWVLARIGDPLVIVPKADDVVEKYVLLSNSHDGTKAVRVGYTPTRVVCANTLAIAHGDTGSALLRVRHTAGMKSTLDAVRNTMAVAHARFEATAEQYRALAARQVNPSDLAKYVAHVFEAPPPKEDLLSFAKRAAGEAKESRSESYARERSERVEALFVGGKGNAAPGVRGTWWAAYNAVTEYLGNDRPRGGTAESRLESLALGGSAAATSTRALGRAVDLATA